MQRIQPVDGSSFSSIPKYHRKRYEFCWHVYRQLAQMLTQHDESRAHRFVADAFAEVACEYGQSPGEVEMLNLLKENGLDKEYKYHLTSNLSLALTADMLRFLHEGLRAIQECHVSIALSLLRKPFKENLIFLAWLLGNEEEFLERFSKNNYETLNGLNEEQQLRILNDAIALTVTPDLFDATRIREGIFSKQNDIGLEPLWQKATHLITKQGRLLKTPDYSINFIFETSDLERIYDILFDWLPDLILLASQIVPECMKKTLDFHEATYSHYLVTTIGYHEVISHRESGGKIVEMLNKVFGPLLQCIKCGEPLAVSNDNAPRLYETEYIECNICGGDTQIPLFWLMNQFKIKTSRDGIQFGDLALGAID
jgi:hypothetical protein